MLEKLLDAAAEEQREQERQRLILKMAASADEMLPIALRALRQPNQVRQAIAVSVLRAIGYPKNAPAIADLLLHIEEPNFLGWDEAVQTLVEMGADMVVPHLIQALLAWGRTDGDPTFDLEGICFMLSNVEPEYARRCCPAINYLLSRKDLPAEIDQDFLLDVIERAGSEQSYVLPALYALTGTAERDEVREHARRIIASFSSNVLADYSAI